MFFYRRSWRFRRCVLDVDLSQTSINEGQFGSRKAEVAQSFIKEAAGYIQVNHCCNGGSDWVAERMREEESKVRIEV
ncbi:unnamed protein product [Heligmosomoides polygyrus]|uniref:Ovule protein n=1 Tax=Heligmosomoides polygyrus TaxID=6339 RepID=A0A183FA65_HELPZ|nr:unnamed protein product [Heligmosomoides polygyrus]